MRGSSERFGWALSYRRLLVTVAILVLPLAFSFYVSFHRWDLTIVPSRLSWVGLRNYASLLASAEFWRVLQFTLVYTFACVAGELVLGLALALLLNRARFGQGVFISLLILPMMMAPIVTGLAWRLMFNPTYGAINQIFHLGTTAWLGDIWLAKLAVIVATIWQETPFVMVLLLAGLRSLPKEPFEAAVIDGAGWWQTLWYITLPLLKPVIMVTMLIRTIFEVRGLRHHLDPDRRRPGRRDGDAEPDELPHQLPSLRDRAGRGAVLDHARGHHPDHALVHLLAGAGPQAQCLAPAAESAASRGPSDRRAGDALVFAALVVATIVFPLPDLHGGRDVLQIADRYRLGDVRLLFTPTLDNYLALIGLRPSEFQFDLGLHFRNSLFAASGSTVLALLLGTPAAYAFARIRFRGARPGMLFLLALRLLPPIATVIPLFLIMRNLFLLDTVFALILAYTTFNLPFIVWMMYSFFLDLPRELEEAALIDGASRLQAFIKVILPLSLPGLAAAAIFSMVLSWNDFIFAVTLTARNAPTLPLMVSGFVTDLGRLLGHHDGRGQRDRGAGADLHLLHATLSAAWGDGRRDAGLGSTRVTRTRAADPATSTAMGGMNMHSTTAGSGPHRPSPARHGPAGPCARPGRALRGADRQRREGARRGHHPGLRGTDRDQGRRHLHGARSPDAKGHDRVRHRRALVRRDPVRDQLGRPLRAVPRGSRAARRAGGR